MSRSGENVQFCEGCPRVPKGIIAGVVEVQLMDSKRLPKLGMAFVDDTLGNIASLVARVGTVVVESDNPYLEPGVEGELFILASGATGNEITERIASCDQPTKKRFGKAQCSAIASEHVVAIQDQN